MNLATLYARHGQPGLERLAKAADLKMAYLQRLLYVLERRPSVERAELLIKASEKVFGRGKGLTLVGLTNPEKYSDAIEREIAAGKAHASHMLRHSKHTPPAEAREGVPAQ